MHVQLNRLFWVIICLVALLAPRSLWADQQPAKEPQGDKAAAVETEKTATDKAESEKPKKIDFIRIKRNKKNVPQSLETAIVTYEGKDADDKPVRVDLIGAVHIADAAYFKGLNKVFKQYDALLYELVAPEDTRPQKGEPSGSVVGSVQRGMKDLLELDFQLDHINYKAKNFVHADMSPKEFAASMKKKGESVLTMAFRMMGHGMATSAKSGNASDAQLMAALFSKNRALQLKRVMSTQFTDIEAANKALGGPDGSTIVNERNKKALAVLSKQLKGKGRKFGIFYGAAHLPDMEKRLIKDFNLKRTKVQWVQAWDMSE